MSAATFLVAAEGGANPSESFDVHAAVQQVKHGLAAFDTGTSADVARGQPSASAVAAEASGPAAARGAC